MLYELIVEIILFLYNNIIFAWKRLLHTYTIVLAAARYNWNNEY